MPMPVVAVIGGGVSGLAFAHRLMEIQRRSDKNFQIALLESSHRLGGIVETEHHEGFLLEKGPDAFIRDKPWALDLAGRLGLQNEIISTRDAGRQSSVFRRGRLVPVPEGFYLISPVKILPFLNSPLFSLGGKWRMLAETAVRCRRSDEDESIAHFVRRRFGSECLERAGQPMLAGIYTGDPERLSIRATLPRFCELEKKYGSVLRGLRKEKKKSSLEASGPRYGLFVSFKNGMQTLTDALAKSLPDESARLNTTVKTVSYSPATKKWILATSSGPIHADALCCTLPGRFSGLIFQQSFPSLSSELLKLRYESVATVHLAYRKNQLSGPTAGFGFVTPASEKKAVIACTFVDRKFEGRAPSDFHLFRAFVGGAFGGEFFEKPDNELVEEIKKELGGLLGIRSEPLFTRLQRHSGSMVQYAVGHLDWLAGVRRLTEEYPGLFLAGASYAGVGIPDCIHEAETQAEKVASFVDSIQP